MPKDLWNTISLNPMTGPLDLRSRPADVLPGGFRWKLNVATSLEGKLCRRAGLARFTGGSTSFLNQDLHHQGVEPREPIRMVFESTAPDGKRRCVTGTQSRLYVLNDETGDQTEINASGSADGHWHAAELGDYILFSDGIGQVISWKHGDPTTGTTDLNGLGVTAVKVLVQYNNCMFAMNMQESGDGPCPTRVRWSDIGGPDADEPEFTEGPDSAAGTQDLPYGDDIIGAATMLGALYIYTRRGIWKVAPSGDSANMFSFIKVYSEPKNQAGCLTFQNTLVSTGSDHYYLTRDSIYHFNPYLPQPERIEWMHRASGAIFTHSLTKIDLGNCGAPVAEFVPTKRELWFSWANQSAQGINNWSLALHMDAQTADVVDLGFTALANYRANPSEDQQCNEVQTFVGASGRDYSLKAVCPDNPAIFVRQFYPGSTENDLIKENAAYQSLGYFTDLVGMIPLGLTDREKTVRGVLLDLDVALDAVPAYVQVRLGNSYTIQDPVSDNGDCGVLWRKETPTGDLSQQLICRNTKSLAQMQTSNLRPDEGYVWSVYEQGRYLYFWVRIKANRSGADAPAVGADVAFGRMDFDARAGLKV